MVWMSQAVAYQIEHWLRINYDKLGWAKGRMCVWQAERKGSLGKWGRSSRGGWGVRWAQHGLVVRCSRCPKSKANSLKQRSSATAHTYTHAVTHPHTHTQSITLSYTHTHTYVAHSSMHMHIKAARGVCVILCIRSLRSVRSPAFVFAIRRRRSRRRKANEYALYLLNKRPF